ncbi:unnamed protein product [Pleuronectes platessa]|uniref:Uncharacterized protein n=1 Tax=Pleuronectes platessa TaxID=8262 RepID=A0A9N7US82_PLEPL|nr:unnamed protein product [Pleuronectes platessa]
MRAGADLPGRGSESPDVKEIRRGPPPAAGAAHTAHKKRRELQFCDPVSPAHNRSFHKAVHEIWPTFQYPSSRACVKGCDPLGEEDSGSAPCQTECPPIQSTQ